MFKTLYGRLSIALLAIFLVVAATSTWVALSSTRLYHQEVSQRLNLDLAEHITHGTDLITDGEIDAEALDALFHSLMVVNPSIEVYLLDSEGLILAYSAPPGHVRLDRVSLEPVRQLLTNDTSIPVFGDDPRGGEAGKVFSVSPVTASDGSLEGYLYVILASEQYDSVVEMLGRSQILRISAGVVVASVVFAFLAALLSFGLLTRRLRGLIRGVEEFRRSDFTQPIVFGTTVDGGDEIDKLAETVRAMSDRIIEQVGELKKTDQLRRDLVANISHDLRTPLAALRGYVDTLRIKNTSLSEDEKSRFLEIAARHSERLRRLIEELFELSKLEANEAKPHFESCAMGELVQDVVQKFQLAASRKEVTLRTDIPHQLPAVHVDIGLMERVLQNLIDNAVQYTPSGGEVVIRIIPKDRVLDVEVSDTGVGISEDELPFVFERFYRAGNENPDHPEGTGLGLAIAKRIVELHGGTLDIVSALNRGTTFTFQSPVRDPAQ